MRTEEIIERFLGLQGLRVTGMEIERDEITSRERLVIKIRRRSRRRICSGCGNRVRGTYDRHTRRWRHLPMFGSPTEIEGEIRRVNCPRCGIRVESVAWARRDSAFTLPFEDTVAWLTKSTNKTAVCRWFGIAWETVGAIVGRVVAEKLPESRFDGLQAIGVDDFFYGKKKAMTLVVDHMSGRFIWGEDGASSETLGKFFQMLGPERCASIKLVSLDMDAGYIKAITEHLPHATIAYDPFHVTQLVNEALDEVRRAEVRDADPDEAQGVKGLRHALRKNPWNLKRGEARRLRELETTNRRVYRAYLLKESLLQAYRYVYPRRAEEHLRKTITWALRSKLKPFQRVARTLRQRFDGVMAAIRNGISNARLEATCRHFRALSARAYGFQSAHALIALGFLYCGNIDINLPW